MKNVLLEETRKISQALPLLGIYSEQNVNSDVSFKEDNQGDISYNKNGVQFYGEMRNRKITGNGELMFKHSFFGNLLYKGDFSKNQPNGYGEFNIGD